MQINSRFYHDILIIEPKGRLTIETEAQFTKVLRTLLDCGTVRFALDLVDVPYVDSVGLGAIVQAYTSARRRGGDLKLMRPGNRITRLLAITKLNTVLKTCDTQDEVERSFDGDCHVPGDIRLYQAQLRV